MSLNKITSVTLSSSAEALNNPQSLTVIPERKKIVTLWNETYDLLNRGNWPLTESSSPA